MSVITSLLLILEDNDAVSVIFNLALILDDNEAVSDADNLKFIRLERLMVSTFFR